MRFAFIDNKIIELSRSQNDLRAHDVASALYDLENDHLLSVEEKSSLEIEIAAWELRPHGGQPSKWGTYYHPLGVPDLLYQLDC